MGDIQLLPELWRMTDEHVTSRPIFAASSSRACFRATTREATPTRSNFCRSKLQTVLH
jgi:hypothetical protein